MKKCVICVIMLLSSLSAIAQQTKVEIDLTKLDSETAKKVLGTLQQEQEASVSPEKISEWTQTAQGVGMAVKEVCSSINVESNEFIKTPVGILVAALLAWKILGASIIPKVLSMLIWLIIVPSAYLSFRRMHFGRKLKRILKDGTTEYYISEPKWEDNDSRGFSAIVHLLIIVAATVAAWIVVCV